MTREAKGAAILGAGILLCAAAARAGASDLDETRSAWRYRRAVELTGAGGFVALAIPPELAARAGVDLADLRLVAPDGSEVPYVVDRAVERQATRQWAGRLVDSRQERRLESRWTIDLGEPRTFDAIDLDVGEQDFAKRLRIELSDDARSWRLTHDDVGIFDRLWSGRIHHTRIEMDAPVTARFLRVAADDRRSSPVSVTGATVSARRRRGEEVWSRLAAVVPLGGDRVSRYRLELPAGLRFETLTLRAGDPAFHRRVVLREEREVNGQRESRALADGYLFRLDVSEELAACEALRLDVAAPSGGELTLEVHDGDSPPLHDVRVSVGGVIERLLFSAAGPRLALYYGNARARAPLYDLAALRDALAAGVTFAPDVEAAALGDESPNPRFRPAPPLPFAPLVGASLDASSWQTRRPLQAARGEDIYTLTLAAGDLAHLRDDFADLRVVDSEGRQVPFILDAGAGEERLALTIKPLAAAASAPGQTTRRSRYRLRVPPVASAAVPALPLSALVVSCKESFFERRAVLTAPPGPRSHPSRPRVLFGGALARASDERAPITIALDGSRLSELQLEIDEGDNAPLTLASVEAVVRVPRIAFKAASGSYQLLLGNRDAAAPRYDLAALRREVLCYSARPVTAGPAEANPAFRRGVAEYFRAAPPTALLWIVLLAAVAALLFLTVRILRQASSGDEERSRKSG